MRFDGRVAIVTGGSRGIGRAYAERLLGEGASVLIADIDDATGSSCVEELSAHGTAKFVRCDVSAASSTEACAAAAVETFGRIDILVNNAAMYGDWNMADQSEEYLRRVFDVNQHGVWLMTRAVAPQMVEQGYGRIINQSSGAAYNYTPTPQGADFDGLKSYNYSLTKWGVVGLTKYTAAQLGAYGITVNCIAPGVIDTEATRNVVPTEVIEFLATKQAVPGVLSAADLTGAMAYFASEEARFVTGQVLVVDGGKYMPA